MTPRRNGNGGIAPYRKRADAKNRRQNPYKPLHFNLLRRVGGINIAVQSVESYDAVKAAANPVPRRRAQRIRRTADIARQRATNPSAYCAYLACAYYA